MVLELAEPIDLSIAKIKFTYSDSDPDGVTRTPDVPHVYTPASGHLRIWKVNGSVARLMAEVSTGGHYVKSDSEYVMSDLGSGRTIALYVEGIDNSATVADQQIKVEVDPDGPGPAAFMCNDAVRVTILKVDLKEVSFSGTDYRAVRLDDDSDDYVPAHWKDNTVPLDGDADDAVASPPTAGQPVADKKYPVSYTRNKKAKVEAKFKVSPVPAGASIKVKGDGPGSLDIPATAAKIAGDTITLSATEMSDAFANTVDYLAPMTIAWKVSLDGGSSWFDAGSSANEVFVTLGVPGCATRFRTVLYLACKTTGGTDASTCLANTWSSFSGPANVCAWNETAKTYSRALHYYQNADGSGSGPGGNTTTKKLLADANGQCHSWADLLKDCLLVNNVGSKRTRIYPPTGYNEFCVKNVVFDDVNPTYPADDPWKYDFSDLDLEPPPAGAAGLAGQNMTTPKAKRFGQHFIVHPTGSATYYDPSYGVTTTGEGDFTTQAIDAWEDIVGGAYHWRKASSAPAKDLSFQPDENW